MLPTPRPCSTPHTVLHRERPSCVTGPTRRRWLAAGLAASLSLGARLVRAAVAPGVATSFLDQLAQAELRDQDGRRLDPRRWTGRLVLVNFVFTGCASVCPLQTRALVELQRQLPTPLRRRVQLISVSLDPLNDTPKALKAYAQRLGIDLATWSLATGRPEAIERLADTLKLFDPRPQARRPDDHGTALWLADGEGQLRMRYAGNPPDLPRLQRELAELDRLTANARS